ncbi:MAG: 16S rRNA processing protein RimM [Chitinophagaceae bacterium]|jgi:16S rRNA processing protein RimM|nr:MAG: 16S rRNA processing protein RimM [Chitinophagaceae bacterium]
MAEYYNTGKIVATYGLHGEMILWHKTGKADAFKEVPAIFIEDKKDSFIPYFIESTRIRNEEEVYLKLEGIMTKEKAAKLLQKQVYLDEDHFRKIVSPGSALFYLGFKVQDKTAGTLGLVAEVVELPAQLLLKIYQNNKELLIPLNPNTLHRIDKINKVIHVILPDGLLDIYKVQ